MNKSYNQLNSEELTEDYLKQNSEFLDDAYKFLREREIGDFDTDEEIYDNFMEHMRKSQVNELDTVGDLNYARRAKEEDKLIFGKLIETYDKKEADFSLKTLGDYAEGIGTAPSTLLSVVTAGAAKAGALTAQQAARLGTRAILKKATENAVLRGAITEGTTGAATELVSQATKVETKAAGQQEIDYGSVGIAGAASSAFAILPSAAIGMMAGYSEKRARDIMELGKENAIKLEKEAKIKTKQTLKDNAKAREFLKNKLLGINVSGDIKKKPLDPTMVKEGQEILLDIQYVGASDIRPSITGEKYQSISAALVDIINEIDPNIITSTKDTRVTEIIANELTGNKNFPKAMEEIMKSYNVTGREMGLVLTADLSEAGRTLSAMREAGKEVKRIRKEGNEKINGILQELKDSKVVSVDDDAAPGVINPVSIFSNVIDVTKDVTRSVEGFRRAGLTSQPQTTVRNLVGGGARIAIDFFEKATEDVLGMTGMFGRPDDFAGGASSILKYMMPAGKSKELVSEMFKQNNLAQHKQLFSVFLDATEIATETNFLSRGLRKGGEALNYFNRLSDNYYKKAVFAGELDRLVFKQKINGKAPRSLMRIIADGEFNKIDDVYINKAIDKAYTLMYQKTPSEGSDSIFETVAAKYINNVDKSAIGGTLMGMLVPFPRFIANQIQFAYERVPILGLLRTKRNSKDGFEMTVPYKDPEQWAKQISGLTLISLAYQARSVMDEGSNWYEYTDENKVVDLRPLLGPLAIHWYIADHLLKNEQLADTFQESLDDEVKTVSWQEAGSEILKAGFGSSLRVGAGKTAINTFEDAIKDIAKGFDSSMGDTDYVMNYNDNVKKGVKNITLGYEPMAGLSLTSEKFIAQILGDYLATYNYMMPIQIAKDVYQLSSAEASMIKNTNGYFRFGDIIKARGTRGLPNFLTENFDYETKYDDSEKTKYLLFKRDGENEIRDEDPIGTALTGVTKQKPYSYIEKELLKHNISTYDIYKPIKFGPADTVAKRILAGKELNEISLFELLQAITNNKEYKSSNSTEKRKILLGKAVKDHVKKAKNRAWQFLWEHSLSDKNKFNIETGTLVRARFEELPNKKQAELLEKLGKESNKYKKFNALNAEELTKLYSMMGEKRID